MVGFFLFFDNYLYIMYNTFRKRRKKIKQKKNICLLIALVIGVAYLIYAVVNFGGAIGGATDDTEVVGAGLATMIVFPHLLCTLVAVIFNALAVFMNKRGFALTSGILYAVAMVLFPLYFMFVIVEMILAFVGYAQLKKQQTVIPAQ